MIQQKRRIERIFIYLASIWQIITGLITAVFYLIDLTVITVPSQSMMGNFIFTYGMAYVTIGILNVVLTKKYVEDDTLNTKILFFWCMLLVLFILLIDYVSIACLVIAIIFSLARNKAIRTINLDRAQDY